MADACGNLCHHPGGHSPIGCYKYSGDSATCAGSGSSANRLRSLGRWCAPDLEASSLSRCWYSSMAAAFIRRFLRASIGKVQDTLFEDIERIEVIRGPGGTIWGANAVNGVINIITKSAKDTHGALSSWGGGDIDQGIGGIPIRRRQGHGFQLSSLRKGFIRASEFHPDGRISTSGDGTTRIPHGLGSNSSGHSQFTG